MSTARQYPSRHLVAIGWLSNGSFVDEQILALTFVEVATDDLFDVNFAGAAHARRAQDDASENLTRAPLDTHGSPKVLTQFSISEVSSWLTREGEKSLTLVGEHVRELADQLRREYLNHGATMPTLDLLDISALARTAAVQPTATSLAALLDNLEIVNSAPGTARGDSLATAAATRRLLAVMSEDRSAPEVESALDELSVRYADVSDRAVEPVSAFSPERGEGITPRRSRNLRRSPVDSLEDRHTLTRMRSDRFVSSVKYRVARILASPASDVDDEPLDSKRFSRTFLKVFFSLYFVFGLGLIALFPPFQSPDAYAHFDRAVGISRGQLVTSTVKGASGSELPVGVFDLNIPFSNIPFNPVQRVSGREFSIGFSQVWGGKSVYTTYSTGAYLPFLYLPQTVGVWIGELVSSHIIVSYYLAELINFMVFVALGLWVMSQLPKRIAFPFAVLLLLPSVLSLVTSVNPDALFIALSMVFSVSVYNRCTESSARATSLGASGQVDDGVSSPLVHFSTKYGLAYVSLFFMVIEKPPYLTLALLLPLADFYYNLRKYLVKVGVFAVASLSVYGLWMKFGANGKGGPAIPGLISPGRQLHFVVYYPVNYWRVLWETFRWGGSAYWTQFITGIGWLDSRFPNWFNFLISVCLIGAVASTSIRRRDKLWKFLFTLLVPVLTIEGILLSFYLIYSPYTWPQIDGIQGRYLIPLIPIFIVLLGLDRARPKRWRFVTDTIVDYAPTFLVSLEFLVAAQFVMTLLARYWY